MNRIIFLLILTVILTSCSSSNEDPTNVELTVLRASLLEKELLIDDLRDTIDDYSDNITTLENELTVKDKTIEEGLVLRQRLLEGQPQELLLANDKETFFDIDKENAFLLYRYNNLSLDYTYESLYKLGLIDDAVTEIELYRGNNVMFHIDPNYSQVYVQDLKKIIVMDYYGKYIYEVELKGDLKSEGDITQVMSTNESIFIEQSPQEELSEPVTQEESSAIDITTEEDSTAETNVIYDELIITHVYFLITSTVDSEFFLEGVYHIIYSGEDYEIQLLKVPETVFLAVNPYFQDDKLFFQSDIDGNVVEFDLTFQPIENE